MALERADRPFLMPEQLMQVFATPLFQAAPLFTQGGVFVKIWLEKTNLEIFGKRHQYTNFTTNDTNDGKINLSRAIL